MGKYDRRSARDWGFDRGWPPYVSVDERKKQAADHARSLAKQGVQTNPVVIAGRKITKTFWGQAWSDNLEAYSDYENRLPRGRSMVRSGSVMDLQITRGLVTALVSGGSIYKVKVEIQAIDAERWQAIVQRCSGQIDSLVALLEGRLSSAVMEAVVAPGTGLFPEPRFINLSCTCPDSARMCKHVAAVMYGIGARLDAQPELLFLLRQVDHLELLAAGTSEIGAQAEQSTGGDLGTDDLGALFGIDLGGEPAAEKRPKTKKKKAAKKVAKRKVAKKKAKRKKLPKL